MRDIVLVLENLPEGGASASEIARTFKAKHWITTSCGNETYSVQGVDDKLSISDSLEATDTPVSFFQTLVEIAPPDAAIVRVRNASYPLHPGLLKEIQDQFPEEDFDYVLSTGEECGLQGYFLERLNRDSIAAITKNNTCLMPPGYFNGMATARSGRHWFSLDLRRFYLEDNFDLLFDSPRSMAINASPACNYNCLKCQYHSPLRKQNGYNSPPLSLDRFRLVLSKCKDFKRLSSVSPTISGEPLMHPQICEIVEAIKKSGYQCGFATNAALLTEEMGKMLLDAGVDSLAFSIDATSSQTYSKLQGGNLGQVEKNIMVFQEETIRRRGSFSGTMVFVVGEHNHSEIEDYRNLWLSRGFNVCFSAEHKIHANFAPHFANERWSLPVRMPCFALWHTIYLQSNGNLLTCGATAVGPGFHENFFDKSPEKFWRSRKLWGHRRLHMSGKTPGYCKQRSCWTGMMGTWVSENGRLLYHTQGSWMEQPSSITSSDPRPKDNWSSRVKKFFRNL